MCDHVSAGFILMVFILHLYYSYVVMTLPVIFGGLYYHPFPCFMSSLFHAIFFLLILVIIYRSNLMILYTITTFRKPCEN